MSRSRSLALLLQALGLSTLLSCDSAPERALMELRPDGVLYVVYDNDEVIDVYTDDYVMALAGAGRIQLIGMVTSSSITPFNCCVDQEALDQMREDRVTGVTAARAVGMTGIPDPVNGPGRHLTPPESGRIGDTAPIGSVGSQLVVDAAMGLQDDAVLHLVMGGPLTLAADAFLLDPRIADRIVVHWLGGRPDDMADYNGVSDPWAAYIVLRRLKLIQYPVGRLGKRAAPSVPKRRLTELPDTPWRSWMISKQHPTNPLPDERDADAAPAIGLVRPEYVMAVRRVAFGGWTGDPGVSAPLLHEDPDGSALVIMRGDKELATQEWWSTMLAAMSQP